MALSFKDFFSGILAAIGGVVLASALNHLIGSYISGLTLILLILGGVLILCAGFIADKVGFLSKPFSMSVGILLVFLTFEGYIGQFFNGYMLYVFLALGVLIILFRDKITEMIMR